MLQDYTYFSIVWMILYNQLFLQSVVEYALKYLGMKIFLKPCFNLFHDLESYLDFSFLLASHLLRYIKCIGMKSLMCAGRKCILCDNNS